MRDIKFRGKSIVTGEWVYGLPHYGSGGSISKIAGWMGESDNPLYDEHEVIPETVGEYTSFHSVDQDEIYENDILHVLYNGRSFDAIVKWRQQSGGFYLSVIETDRYIEFNELGQSGDGDKIYLSDCRIIGNIFEKPDLHETTC